MVQESRCGFRGPADLGFNPDSRSPNLPEFQFPLHRVELTVPQVFSGHNLVITGVWQFLD